MFVSYQTGKGAEIRTRNVLRFLTPLPVVSHTATPENIILSSDSRLLSLSTVPDLNYRFFIKNLLWQIIKFLKVKWQGEEEEKEETLAWLCELFVGWWWNSSITHPRGIFRGWDEHLGRKLRNRTWTELLMLNYTYNTLPPCRPLFQIAIERLQAVGTHAQQSTNKIWKDLRKITKIIDIRSRGSLWNLFDEDFRRRRWRHPAFLWTTACHNILMATRLMPVANFCT